MDVVVGSRFHLRAVRLDKVPIRLRKRLIPHYNQLKWLFITMKRLITMDTLCKYGQFDQHGSVRRRDFTFRRMSSRHIRGGRRPTRKNSDFDRGHGREERE